MVLKPVLNRRGEPLLMPLPSHLEDFVLFSDDDELIETCPRCAAEMVWAQSSLHCPVCRYKEGCCG